MTRPVLVAACAALGLSLSLSGCGLWGQKKGVGFTGIDGEPKVLTNTFATEQGDVTQAESVPIALAGLPPVRLQAEAETQADRAAVAIPAGGTTPRNAVVVGDASQTMMLSTVEVNGELFAVLRVPEGGRGRMAEGAGPAFVSSVPRLTGCLAGSGAYAQGSAERPKGLAVKMNCS